MLIEDIEELVRKNIEEHHEIIDEDWHITYEHIYEEPFWALRRIDGRYNEFGDGLEVMLLKLHDGATEWASECLRELRFNSEGDISNILDMIRANCIESYQWEGSDIL